jgi:hypothetical protein
MDRATSARPKINVAFEKFENLAYLSIDLSMHVNKLPVQLMTQSL